MTFRAGQFEHAAIPLITCKSGTNTATPHAQITDGIHPRNPSLEHVQAERNCTVFRLHRGSPSLRAPRGRLLEVCSNTPPHLSPFHSPNQRNSSRRVFLVPSRFSDKRSQQEEPRPFCLLAETMDFPFAPTGSVFEGPCTAGETEPEPEVGPVSLGTGSSSSDGFELSTTLCQTVIFY
jgi:hypothetical protein